MRLLFCIASTAISGGSKILFELANRLAAAGETVDIFSYGPKPHWFEVEVPFLPQRDINQADLKPYDFVLISNAFLIPLVLERVPAGGRTIPVYICQGYESYLYGNNPQDLMQEIEAFSGLFQLPVPVIATSRSIQELLWQNQQKKSHYVPCAIDRTLFHPGLRQVLPKTPKRVLLVGNYLYPLKGMDVAFEALTRLNRDLPVQLVLITQETRWQQRINDLPFAVEVHTRPPQQRIPEIYASCHVYVCSSYYEGLGLPALEAFCTGTPVVSTRTQGVNDYGIHQHNLLLAEPGSAEDICRQLKRILTDEKLAQSLVQNAFKTVETRYTWPETLRCFGEALATIRQNHDEAYLHCDPKLLAGLLDNLEAAGCYTPVEVHRLFERLSQALESWLVQTADSCTVEVVDFETLEQLKEGFKTYLHNPGTQYYDLFRERYDLCRLLLAFKTEKHFIDYVKRILSRHQTEYEHQPAVSLP